MATTLLTVGNTLINAGNFQSSTFTFPATGFKTISVAFNILDADFTNAAKSMGFAVLVQQPDTSFITDSGFQWKGGGSKNITDKFGNPIVINGPTLTASVGNLVSKTCKLSLTLPVSLTTAITVTAI